MASKKFVVKNGLRSDGNVLINKSIDNNTDELQVAGSVSVSDQVKSTLATGTAPMIIASTTAVSNLNADLLDGEHGAYYLDGANFTGTLPNNYVTLGTDTAGNYVATIAGTANEVEVTGSGSETAAVTIGLPDDVTIGNELTVTTALFTPIIDTTDSSAITIVPEATFNSNVTVENSLTVGNDVAITGSTVSTGDVTAARFFGDGRGLTGLVATYDGLTDTNTAGRSTGSLNRFDGSAYVPTAMTEDASGNVTVSGQLNVSTVDTTDSSAITVVPSATFNSDVTVENTLTVGNDVSITGSTVSTGDVTAARFFGDGSNLTGLTATYDQLTDTNTTGRTTGSLNRFNGSTYVPTTMTEDASGNVITNGDVTFTGDNNGMVWNKSDNALDFERGDGTIGQQIRFRGDDASGFDSSIYVSPTNSEMIVSSSNTVRVYAGNNFLVQKPSAAETMINAAADGSVSLYYDGSKKLETVTDGVEITNTLYTSNIDTTDSSAITVTPIVNFDSDVNVGNNLIVDGYIGGPATMVIDPAAIGDDTGEVIIAGNLTVQGNTTQVDSNVVNIGDAFITLNSDETSTPSQNAGIEVERGTSTNVALRWNETTDKWEITTDGSAYNAISTVDATVTSLTGTANEVEVDVSTGDVTVGLPDDVTIGNELTVTTGLFTPLIDTADSSALTVTPATVFSSDITVENDIVANNKITVSGNVVANANVVVSDEVQFTGHSNASSTLTTTATTQVALHNLSISAYAGAEVFITAVQGNVRHITKLLITHDASDAYATEYGEILSGASLATYDVDLSGGNIRLLTTPASATSTKFNVSVVQLYN